MHAASPWYTLSTSEVLYALHTSAQGLKGAEARRRLTEHGPNELAAIRRVSPWALLLTQCRNMLTFILFIAAGLSFWLGHSGEATAIAVIVLFAVLLGFMQEYRAERTLEALRRMAVPTATVLRDGHEREVPARALVPGDLILVQAGMQVPADARLIEAVNLQVEEAALSGESMPVEKHTPPLDATDLTLGDRKNMLYAGTVVTHGRGRAVVVATGMHTEFGNIARLLQNVETGQTPLQANLKKVGRLLAIAALGIVAAIVALGLYRGQPFIDMVIFGIALAVAVVPEALPAVVTTSLVIGVRRMARRQALMRRLAAVETLGSTSIICSDKTGTLTKDEMTVRQLWVASTLYEVSGAGYTPQGEFFHDGKQVETTDAMLLLLQAAALASDARLDWSVTNDCWELNGDPTEGALVVTAAKAGIEKAELEMRFPRVHEIPFSSESKRMTTLHQTSRGLVAYTKGAPEVILESCTCVLTETDDTPLTPDCRAEILEAAQTMARGALRVLAVALGEPATPDSAEYGLTFVGLIGMIDPPRPEAQAAIQTCEQAGIKVVMMTGDHPLTAQAIARDLGLLGRGRLVTGVELAAMPDIQLAQAVGDIEIYARVSPEHKLRVVTALQQQGHVVAMTGDGVNDAPALKKADIGIAMGITGTDVTKEAADMTLTDDNFASIVAAVEEGRVIFGNIKKYLMYLLSSNIGEIGLMAGAALLGWPLPLSAVQILYVNLATDGLPALALAVDPPEADLMRRRPRNTHPGIFTRPVVLLMLIGGLWSAAVNLTLFGWASRTGSLQHAMTLTFVSLVLIQLFKAYNYRSERLSVLCQPFANRWLNLAILWALALLLVIVYMPWLQRPFATSPLTLTDWLIAVAMAGTVSPVLELAKWMERGGWFGQRRA